MKENNEVYAFGAIKFWASVQRWLNDIQNPEECDARKAEWHAYAGYIKT
ncbi:MAG: hypothetical protein ABI921_03550 [Panacibacter sp.]